MRNQQRLKTIELSMTPSQAVLLWFEKTKKAGSFEQGSQQSPAPRKAIAKAVESLIRRGMKAEPEHLLQEAVRQAQQEADSLYLLIIEANVAALHGIDHRNKYLMLVSGHMLAVRQALEQGVTEARMIDRLRLSLVCVLEDLLSITEACTRITSSHLQGQQALFPEVSNALTDQLQMAKSLLEFFNEVAQAVGATCVDMENIRISIQPEVDRMAADWVDLARMQMLTSVGGGEEWREPQNRILSRETSAP